MRDYAEGGGFGDEEHFASFGCGDGLGDARKLVWVKGWDIGVVV